MSNSFECADKKMTHTAKLLAGCDIALPFDPHFVSKSPNVELAIMFKRCEELLSLQTSKFGFEEKRLRDKVDIEFVL